jgi:hypothetical protein
MRITARILRGCSLSLISLSLFTLLSVPSVARDKNARDKKPGEEIQVLANLPLQDIQVNQLFVQEWGGKSYLYLHQPKEDNYALVDVTRPEKPTLVNRNAVKGSPPEGNVGNSPLAITTTQDEAAAQKAAPKELPAQTINFVDTSNPKDPKTIKSFKGVTAMYSDDTRKLVYLVNPEGLWIVRHRNTTPVPVCGASGVYGPNCPAF